jgi:hypothetical protein
MTLMEVGHIRLLRRVLKKDCANVFDFTPTKQKKPFHYEHAPKSSTLFGAFLWKEKQSMTMDLG